MMKRSLGPWFAHERDNTIGAPKTDIVDETGDPVFANCLAFDPTEEQAAMISAAPDMRGALRFILAFYEPGQRYLDTEAWKQAEASGRRALAKAGG